MTLENEKNRISAYISSDKRWPIIVDLQNRKDLAEIKSYFDVGESRIIGADFFCGKDGVLKVEELLNAISDNQETLFITGITTFLKIQGAEYSRKILGDIVQKSIKGHIVILTYQCKNLLKFSDPRIFETGRIIISNGKPDILPNICFISPELAESFPGCYKGFHTVSSAIEGCDENIVYIATSINKSSFPESIYSINQLDNGYDILCDRDGRTKVVPRDFGTADQWNYVLNIMGESGSWDSVINEQFDSSFGLSQRILSYASYTPMKKWLYFIALSVFGVEDNAYLQLVINNTDNYLDLIKAVFRTILSVDRESSDFYLLYEQRKSILTRLPDVTTESVDFCKVVASKEENQIYYLTDVTQSEREKIIAWLDNYGSKYDAESLRLILDKVYPDLADYLTAFRFKNEFLDKYFAQYKYQKLINHIMPDFEEIVNSQTQALDFVTLLKPRTTIVEKLDVNESQAFFFDALGVEYLGYIQKKCNDYGLSTSISYGRAELPTLTCFNKDFVETLQSKGCPISDIKDLDEIKHHGEDDFDYEKVKTPVYLISELNIIDELLKKIKASIASGKYNKAIILSDHGASRLAVLHNTENIWQMATSGVHSGRCCPKNDVDSKPDFAIEAGDFWVLANYDRFKGGRKGNCEVHGGASFEEVTVPIVEIRLKNENIEAFIVDESRVFVLGAEEYPTLKIYVGVISNNVCIKLNGEYYDAVSTSEDYIYTVELSQYSKKGIYSLDIIVGSDIIASGQTFEIKRKGMSENKLFG